MEDYGRFLALLVSALLVGFVSVIFSLVWVFHYREGLSWDGSPREFNWHPVLIITGFVFIQGIALVYPGRGLPCPARRKAGELCFPSQPEFVRAGKRNARSAARGKFPSRLALSRVPGGEGRVQYR